MKENKLTEQSARQKLIVRTSLVGVLVNVLLAGMKAAVGLLANSIAVVLDAVNNLSDALSSVITIVLRKEKTTISTPPSARLRALPRPRFISKGFRLDRYSATTCTMAWRRTKSPIR